MATECSEERSEFARVKGRSVVAGFDGGTITADAGTLSYSSKFVSSIGRHQTDGKAC